jgi:hypothetical protein
MNYDRLLEACERELIEHVEQLFRNTHPKSAETYLADIPVIGGPFFPDLIYTHAPLITVVCAALVARERFELDRPAWARELPLHQDARQEMIDNEDDPCLQLIGHYAESLSGVQWDYDLHPRFSVFASGIMACEWTPAAIREDRGLAWEFPARTLEGLCDGRMIWRTPAIIAMDRENAARGAALEARQKAAMARRGG